MKKCEYSFRVLERPLAVPESVIFDGRQEKEQDVKSVNETAKRQAKRFAALLLCAGAATYGWSQSPLNAAPAAPAEAVTQSPLKIRLDVFKVTLRNSREELVSAAQARPGDLLEYRATYSNEGNRTLRNIAATLPIPASLAYSNGSASPGGVLASTDSRNYVTVPLKRVVKLPDGRTRIELVPFSEYRSLRWNVASLEAGKSFRVSARARVLSPR